MGPTNVLLVQLFQADQHLRQAQQRLDAASRNVRVQERRVEKLTTDLKAAQTKLRETQTKSSSLELDLKSRDAHIEKLRTQQQTAKTNKEYQTFLIEINTGKVDRSKIEDELIKVMEQVEAGQAEVTATTGLVETESAKLGTMSAEIGETVANLQAEVAALQPARDAAAAALPAKARDAFERLADHHDGEAMAAISKPDRRREEYLCNACNIELVRDVYNKLHTRDEIVFCPSCKRILYIPEDLSPEIALGLKKDAPRKVKAVPAPRKVSSSGSASTPDHEPTSEEAPVTIEPRAKGKLGEVLKKAQAESVSRAMASDHKPAEFEVYVDNELAGIYKGNSAESFERVIKFFLGEAGLSGEVRLASTKGAGDAANSTSQSVEETPAANA